jgi:hypothetical protein
LVPDFGSPGAMIAAAYAVMVAGLMTFWQRHNGGWGIGLSKKNLLRLPALIGGVGGSAISLANECCSSKKRPPFLILL